MLLVFYSYILYIIFSWFHKTTKVADGRSNIYEIIFDNKKASFLYDVVVMLDGELLTKTTLNVIISYIHMYLEKNFMSIQTALSIKEEHRKKYICLRDYLNQKNQSLGDYLIQNWDEEFNNKTLTTNN